MFLPESQEARGDLRSPVAITCEKVVNFLHLLQIFLSHTLRGFEFFEEWLRKIERERERERENFSYE